MSLGAHLIELRRRLMIAALALILGMVVGFLITDPVLKLITEPYDVQAARWPQSGRHILAQFDDEFIVVYQAYRPAIGHFAARHGHFGGGFSLNR